MCAGAESVWLPAWWKQAWCPQKQKSCLSCAPRALPPFNQKRLQPHTGARAPRVNSRKLQPPLGSCDCALPLLPSYCVADAPPISRWYIGAAIGGDTTGHQWLASSAYHLYGAGRGRVRRGRAESTWTAGGLCNGRAGLQVHSMGWREQQRTRQWARVCAVQVTGRRKKEDSTGYGPTPYACRLASCTQGWLPSIPNPDHAQAPPDE